ncbi:hypothetical protein AVEN_204983-1, partial [Araneus ventricosus]
LIWRTFTGTRSKKSRAAEKDRTTKHYSAIVHPLFNPLIPKTIRIEGHQNTGTSQFLFQRYPKFTCPLKNRNDSSHSRNYKKTFYSPNPSGRAILTKDTCAAGVKSITFNDRGWKLYSDIRTATVFFL